jgi:uncharacterized protein (DUF697 family)
MSSNRSKSDAERDARSVVNAWTAGAAAIGWVPGSMLVLAGMDAKVVHDVARAFEVPSYKVEEVAAAIGASVTGKIVAGELLTLFPGIGWLIKSAVAGAITKGLGESLIASFRDRTTLA